MVNRWMAVIITLNSLDADIIHNWSAAAGWLTALLLLASREKYEKAILQPVQSGVR
jgi:hypothetical protein